MLPDGCVSSHEIPLGKSYIGFSKADFVWSLLVPRELKLPRELPHDRFSKIL